MNPRKVLRQRKVKELTIGSGARSTRAGGEDQIVPARRKVARRVGRESATGDAGSKTLER
jgi:hypothetical protein